MGLRWYAFAVVLATVVVMTYFDAAAHEKVEFDEIDTFDSLQGEYRPEAATTAGELLTEEPKELAVCVDGINAILMQKLPVLPTMHTR